MYYIYLDPVTGILTSVDSEDPVQLYCQLGNSLRIFKRLAKALIRLRVCTGWSEALLVALTTLLEISCHCSNRLAQGRNTLPSNSIRLHGSGLTRGTVF